MCGRYSLTIGQIEKLQSRFHLAKSPLQWEPRYNIAPAQTVPVIISQAGQSKLNPMVWGLVPFWSKEKTKPRILINTRCETFEEKPVFKSYLKKRRCLVPADGFYEWKHVGSKKVPYRATLKDNSIFSFAGIWDWWEEREIYTFSIITTNANSLLDSIHDRMPVILDEWTEQEWLTSNEENPEKLLKILKPYPSKDMKIYQVSSVVNSAKNDCSTCINPS